MCTDKILKLFHEFPFIFDCFLFTPSNLHILANLWLPVSIWLTWIWFICIFFVYPFLLAFRLCFFSLMSPLWLLSFWCPFKTFWILALLHSLHYFLFNLSHNFLAVFVAYVICFRLWHNRWQILVRYPQGLIPILPLLKRRWGG